MFTYLLIAAIQDVCCSKVSNDLIFLGYCISMIYQCIYQKNIVIWLIGVCAPVFVLFILFFLKMIGAGDIKLMSVLGGFYGWKISLKVFLLALLYGSVWSVVKFIVHRNMKERFLYFFQYVQFIFLTKKRISYRNNDAMEKSYTIPFCVTILWAYCSLVWGGVC
nr:prepilin peptidase [uncultured Lachnoclostridium sp.]